MACGDSLLNLLDLCFKLIFILIFNKLGVNRNLVTLVMRGCQTVVKRIIKKIEEELKKEELAEQKILSIEKKS